MTVIEMYEKVNIAKGVEQRIFFNLFNDTVDELVSLYGTGIFTGGRKDYRLTSLYEENPVLPLYHTAITENILSYVTGDEIRKNEFMMMSNEAWLRYWNDIAKGRRIRARGFR